MRQFRVTGKFIAYLTFQKEKHFTININKDKQLVFPLSITNNIVHDFELTLHANDLSKVEGLAKDVMDRTAGWLSFIFATPVDKIEINNIEDLTSKQQRGVLSHSISFYTAGSAPVDDQKSRLFFQKLTETLNPGDETVLGLYRKMLNTTNKAEKFWHIYNILQILKGSPGSGSERVNINDYIQNTFPTSLGLYNDRGKNDKNKKRWSILICIRDAFSHEDARFSDKADQLDGLKLDINQELYNHINLFQEIARKAIKDKLNLSI